MISRRLIWTNIRAAISASRWVLFIALFVNSGPVWSQGNSWSSLASTPAGIGSGNTGRLTAATGTDTLYQLRGGATPTLYRYVISTNSWTTHASAPADIRFGATLLYPNTGDSVYANRGGNNAEFWSYSISNNYWDTLASLPMTAGDGAAGCVTGNDTIFSSVGGSANFYRYVISTNTWTAMTAAPGAFNNGASMTYPGSGDFIYAFAGSGTTFYRYSISGNSWTTLTPYPSSVSFGSSLAFGPDGFLYGCRGGATNEFWKYNVTTDSWTQRLTNTLTAFSDGSGLTYPRTGIFIYAVAGGGSSNFERYQFPSTPDTPTSLAQTKLDSTSIVTGGQVRDTTSVLFSVSAGDPTDTVRIQLELRPVGTALTRPINVTIDNVNFFQSGFSSSATPETLSVAVHNLLKDTYHWAIRVVDSTGDSTGWVSFGANAENPPTNPAATDFYVDSTAPSPDTPTSLTQTRLDTSVVSTGGTLSDTTSIRIAVRASDPTDTVRVQVELRSITAAFTSPVNVTIDSVVFFQSSFSSSTAETLLVNIHNLVKDSYHWQVRVVDSRGDSTGWVGFGNNAENPPTNPAAADFIIDSAVPASMARFDSAYFIVTVATASTESAQVRVLNSSGSPIEGVAVTWTIVAAPTGASGHSILTASTNALGISQCRLTAGDKAGVYVVKATLGSLSPIYFSFTTNEYDLPASTWRLISPMRTPADARVANAFNGFSPTDIVHWNPEAEDHARLRRYEIPSSIAVAKGYYVRNPTAVRFTVSGTQLTTDTKDIPLKTGWNQIGTPFPYLTRWNSAKIVTSGGSVMTVAEAEAAGVIQNRIFWYKDNAYQFGPSSSNGDPILTPWNGFWLKAASDATLRLPPEFYYSETTTPALVSAQAAGLGVDNWQITLTAAGDGGGSVTNFLGVSPQATNGTDFALDVDNPPTVSGQFATGLGAGGAFAQDIKAPFKSAAAWDFLVTPASNDNNVALSFTNLGNLPQGFIVILLDRTTGALTTITSTPTYSFSAAAGGNRSFRIVIGTEAEVKALLLNALTPSVTFAYPNPGPGADGFVRFKYNAIAPGFVSLKVFDLGGRKVIERLIDLNTFPSEYAWDCRNDRGQAISTGIYVYTLEYGAGNDKARIVDKLAISR